MAAQFQFAPTEAQRDCSSDQSAQTSKPVASATGVPLYIKALPYVFNKNMVDGLSYARKGLLLIGAFLLMEATTITSSGFSSKMSWWRVALFGTGYLLYYGVSMAHAILAPAVEVVALKMKEFNEFSKTMPPEGLELMKALVRSPPEFSPDGALMNLPPVDTASLPELTPETEAEVLAVVEGFLKDTMLAYKKMRKGDKNPFSHFMLENAAPQKAVIEEILDDDVVQAPPRSDASYDDLGDVVEEIVIGAPPSKSN